MAFTPYGFDGTVSEGAQVADLTVHPGEYGVGGFRGTSGDCRVTIVSGVDRTVRVATGYAWGKGVAGYNAATVDVQATTISSGTRWDTVVLRRDTSANTLTPLILAGTSAQAIAVSREVGYTSNKDDQPIALIRLVAGQSNVQEVVDIRCWAANGGLFALSTYALGYLETAGTVVQIGNTMHRRTTDGAGTDSWTTYELVPGDSGWVAPSPWGLNYGTNSTAQTRKIGNVATMRGYFRPLSGSISAGRTGSVGVVAHPPTATRRFPAVAYISGHTTEYQSTATVEISSSGNVYLYCTGSTTSVIVDDITYRTD